MKSLKDYFIIGDVHGCYYTLKEMLDKHWDKHTEKLIILGDVVNKGKHTFAVLEYLINLKEKYPKQFILLKGNNEYLFEKYYRESLTLYAKQKFENYNLYYIEVLNWLDELPHFWENGKIFASHAGVPAKMNGLEKELEYIFNKKKLKNISKTQFVGHVVVDEPKYDKESNAWYLDTGAGHGKKLTGAKVNSDGEVLSFVSIDVNRKDIPKFN